MRKQINRDHFDWHERVSQGGLRGRSGGCITKVWYSNYGSSSSYDHHKIPCNVHKILHGILCITGDIDEAFDCLSVSDC